MNDYRNAAAWTAIEFDGRRYEIGTLTQDDWQALQGETGVDRYFRRLLLRGNPGLDFETIRPHVTDALCAAAAIEALRQKAKG